MAKAHGIRRLTVILELNEDEARWLKAWLQNPVLVDGEGGSEFDSNVRKDLFEQLKVALPREGF